MPFNERALDDYIDVAERIAEFKTEHPDGSLRCVDFQIKQVEGWEKGAAAPIQQTFIVYQAAAYRTPDDPAPGVGTAWEVFPGRTPYTRGSELMNAETSAWGRALAALGIATKRGISSREEVRNRQAERDDGLPTNKDGSLSRSRTTDEEKAAAGVMTDAQSREHNKMVRETLAGGDRAVRLMVAAEDAGLDFSQAQDLGIEPERAPMSIDSRQRNRIMRHYSKMDRQERLDRLGVLVGHAVESVNDLSMVEANQVIEHIERQAR